jgi:putative ABC transport system ATP-binding protein
MQPTPAQNSPPAIEMRDVSVAAIRDQSLIVAEQINWKVAPGEYWVIAGLQGSGKTDFLMMTGGLMPPAAGEYRFFDEAMPIFEDARLKHRLRLGLVFDGGQLFNHLTVRENVMLPLRYHYNLGREQAASLLQPLLERLELAPWADSTPGVLARNWAKRVGLARALALRPEVLLIDNPLGGLDLRHANWWLGFLDQLSRGDELSDGRRTTLVVTTADLRPWRGRAARQFAILRERHLSVLGTWAQVEAVSEELVRELLLTDHGATKMD